MADQWTETVLLTIRERPWRDGKGFGCWVVQKSKNGASHRVEVRAGMYFPDKVTGEKRLPKEGLEVQDFEALAPLYRAKVEPLLRIPKGTLVAVQDAPPDETIEEAPW